MPTQYPLKKILVLFIVFVLAAIFLPVQQQSAQAQDGDPLAEITRLAREVHIQNLRSGRGTDWIGGNLGVPGASSTVQVGRQLTDWQLEDIYDETIAYDLASMERPVMMNLWASWCGPCRFEFPFLTEFNQRNDLNFDLWFVNVSDTNKSAAQRFLRDQDPNITALYDPNNAFANQVGNRFLPTTLLVDTDGTIIIAHAGIVTETALEFFNAVAATPRQGSFDASTVRVDLVELLQPIDPASAVALNFGSQAAGNLSDDDWREDYRFEGSADETVTLNLTYTGGEVDPYVVLVSPSGELVNPDAEGSESDNAGLSLQFSLPENGTYVVIVSRFLEAEGFGEGSFNILLSRPGMDQPGSGNALLVQYGVSSSGVLTYERKQDAYILEAMAGETLTFTLSHDLPEEQLNLQARMGSVRLVPYTRSENGEIVVSATVEESGTYSLYVARSNSSRAGPITYTLIVTTDVEASQAPSGQGESQTISYGDSVSDVINDENFERRYSFEGNMGDVVNIFANADLTAGNLDVSLTLLGSDESLLAENDDIDLTTTDAAITEFELPMAGIYTIVVGRFQGETGFSSGSFTLSLEASVIVPLPDEDTEAPETTPPDETSETPDEVDVNDDSDIGDELDVETITAGETRSGELGGTAPFARLYTFEAEAGDVVTISATTTAGNLDTVLVLLDPDDAQVALNDDADFATRDSLIEDLSLPASGTYTIVIGRFGGAEGQSAGTYELSLMIGAETGDLPPEENENDDETPALPQGDLTDGALISGEITDDVFSNSYTFSARAGDFVTIEMDADTDSALDPLLRLYDADGNLIAENDDRDIADTDAAIADFEIPTDGLYTIVATRFNVEEGLSSGAYSLRFSLNASRPPSAVDTDEEEPPTSATDTTLEYGAVVTGTITNNDYEVQYTFEGNAGDAVTIDATASPFDTLDTTLVLLGPDGEMVAVNDDRDLFGGDYNALLAGIILPQDGTYTIVVGRYQGASGTSTGEFTLILDLADESASGQVAIAYGETLVGTINNENYQDSYVFEGVAGDVVSIEVIATSGDLDTIVSLVGPSGEVLDGNDDVDFEAGNTNSALRAFVLPSDGTYTILVGRYEGRNGTTTGNYTLELILESGEAPVSDDGSPPTALGEGNYSGAINEQNIAQRFSFEGEAGQSFVIEMTAISGNLDALLIVQDADGKEVGRNDDRDFATTDAALTLTLPNTGTYTVIATRYQEAAGGSAGEFELSIRPIE